MSRQSVHIIGGGIIGLCSAWYLNQKGYDVVVIERNDLTNGTSHGNAGMIVPSHVMPLASPGVISQGIKWMFNSKSPFYVKPRMDASLLQWLYQFYKSCSNEHVERSMPVLFQLNEWSKSLYDGFVNEPGFGFNFEKKGLLMLYKTPHQEKEEKELAEKAGEVGLEARVLSASELKEVEPDIELDALGGVYFPGDAHLYPNKFMEQLATRLKDKGVQFVTGKEVVDLKSVNGRINEVLLSDGVVLSVEKVLVTGGAWSAKIIKKAGVKIYLQDGKGYSITIKNASIRPNTPAILTEAKVAVTPMGNDLRIGGTLELGGLSTNINRKRLSGIVESISRYYPEINIPEAASKHAWYGYRPCSPDGIPYIGRSAKTDNLYVATGHAMMGLSMGPGTGKLISEIINNEQTTIDTTMFSLERF